MDSSSSAIKIENVWKVFGNTSKIALDAIQNDKISKNEALEKYNSVIGVSDVSFDVKQGEIFCVMGLSGSGKSTLVRHINRLLEPTSGKILINNQDVMALNREDLQELLLKEKVNYYEELLRDKTWETITQEEQLDYWQEWGTYEHKTIRYKHLATKR